LMTDERANVVLEHLRAIGARVEDMAVDIADIKQRMGLLGGQIAHLLG